MHQKPDLQKFFQKLFHAHMTKGSDFLDNSRSYRHEGDKGVEYSKKTRFSEVNFAGEKPSEMAGNEGIGLKR